VSVAVPAGVVTATSTAPAACTGVVAVIRVAEFTVNDVAAVPPNVTPVAPVKFVPVIVTAVPPRVVPDAGSMADTVGGGRGAEIVNDGREIAKKMFPTQAIFTRAVAPTVCVSGRVTACEPSFGVEARSVVWKEAPLSVEREIATLAQEIGVRFVFATFQVTVCVELAGQVTADAGAVIAKGPAVETEATVVVSEFTPPPPLRLSRAVRRKFIVRLVVGIVSP